MPILFRKSVVGTAVVAAPWVASGRPTVVASNRHGRYKSLPGEQGRLAVAPMFPIAKKMEPSRVPRHP